MKIKAILVMMLVVAGFVVPGWADFTTVGVYDPTDAPHFNDADKSAVYSGGNGGASAANVIDLAEMQAAILIAYPLDMGGVVDAEGERDIVWVNGYRTIRAKYGVGQAKTVDMTDNGNDIGTDDGVTSRGETPISGDHRFTPGTPGGFSLTMGNIVGDPGEKVIMIGGTYLQETDRDAAAQGHARFSDGSNVYSTANLFTGDGASMQDTFFGFVAPAGEYITYFHVGQIWGRWRDMDDIGFITSTGPFAPSANAGPDQLGVQLWDATGLNVSTGVQLAGSVALPIGETYTYTWSGGFDTIDENGTTGADDAIVTFTAGTYVLTLNVTGSISGPLYSDTVTIEVIESDSNAGSNQTEQLHIASSSAGVTLDGSVDDPYDGVEGAETYTYTWSGDFATITDNGTATAADPNVTFTATGDYILTLVATGSVQGALASDTVRIRVVIPVLDAGDDVQLEKTIAAYPGVKLDSTLSNPVGGETYTYGWASAPSATAITVATDEDPWVTFPAEVDEYILTLNVTSDGVTPPLVDTVTVNVVEDYRMVAHFEINSGEKAAAKYLDTAIYFADPNNNDVFTTVGVGASENHDAVVGCGDSDAIQNSNGDPLEVHLNHASAYYVGDGVPNLDNLDTAITVAFWIRNDYGRKVWAIEKEGTFAFGIDDRGDLRTKLWFDNATDSLTKSREGDGLGNDLESNGLKINADGASGGGQHVWHHIAFTYDSFTGYVEQFLDGALIRAEDIGSGRLLNANTNSLFIGKNVTDLGGSFNDGLRGSMDDIRVYNYPLDYYEIAGLASMGQAATLVAAGGNVTVDPNELPYELQGRFIRLGQGVNEVSPDNTDPNDPFEYDAYAVMWEQRSADPNTQHAIFSDPGDPESDVTFTGPGTYTLRLVSFERLCQSGPDDNESRDEMIITVLPASDCAGYLALGGARHPADIIGDDCNVGLLDFAEMAMDYLIDTGL